MNHAALNIHAVVQSTAQNSGWGERGLTAISTTFVVQSSPMGCSVCMTQIVMQPSASCSVCSHSVLVQSLIISDPAALKLQAEWSIVQETNWPCSRDFSSMLSLEEWCVLMNVQSWKLSLITQKLQGESNAAWKSSQLTLYLSQTTLGHAELRKQWEKEENHVPD